MKFTETFPCTQVWVYTLEEISDDVNKKNAFIMDKVLKKETTTK